MKRKNTVLILLFALTTGSSCYKDPPSSPTAYESRIEDFVQGIYPLAATDGSFSIQSTIPANDSVSLNNTQMGGSFRGKDGLPVSGGTVTIANRPQTAHGTIFGFDAFFADTAFFGRIQTFSLTPPGGSNSFNATIYVPAPIHVRSTSLNANSTNIFRWTRDPLHTKAAVAKAQYLPDLPANDSVAKSGYHTLISNSMSIPDGGETTLPDQFWAPFPAGSTIKLEIGRGNYYIIESLPNTYKIYSFTNGYLFLTKK